MVDNGDAAMTTTIGQARSLRINFISKHGAFCKGVWKGMCADATVATNTIGAMEG